MTSASDRSILNETGKSAAHDVAERGAYDQASPGTVEGML